MKPYIAFIFTGLTSLILSASAEGSLIVSVNIGYDGTTNFLDSSESAGVVAAQNWNNLSHSQGTLDYSNSGTSNGSPSPNSEFYSNTNTLVDSTGANTSVGFEMVGGNISNGHFDDSTGNGTDLTDPNDDMFAQGFRFDSDTTLQLTGLTSTYAGAYDVYLYFGDRTTQDGTIGVSNGSTTYHFQLEASGGGTLDVYQSAGDFDQITSTDSLNPTLNGDYLVFEDQTGSIFSATVTGGGNQSTLSGIQIVGTPIPEPSSALILSLLGIACLTLRRRRR